MKRLFFAGEILILVHEFLISVDPNVFSCERCQITIFLRVNPPLCPHGGTRRWTGPEKWRCDVCQFQLEETGTRGDGVSRRIPEPNENHGISWVLMGFNGI